MAIPAAWFIITWGDTTLAEVRDIDVDLAIDEETLIVPRSGDALPAPITGTIGRVLMTGFSDAGLPPIELGQTKLMTIKKRIRVFGPLASSGDILTWKNKDNIIWTGFCRYERRRLQAVVNGAVLFAFEFKFMTRPSETTGTEEETAAAAPP